MAVESPEEYIYVRIYNEVANGDGLPPVDTLLRPPSRCRDIIAYRDQSNLLSILANVVKSKSRRITRVLVRDQASDDITQAQNGQQSVFLGQSSREETSGLAVLEQNFLDAKGAFSIPSATCR